MGKPSALVLSALLSLYCVIIPFARWLNNNDASSNNMIMHRHPLRDNMLHTIAMQIMALHVHTKAEQRPCRAASLSACRPTRTYTHAQTHMHTVCSFRFCSVSCLSQGPCSCAKAPTTPPTPPRLKRPLCLPVWNSASGWGGLGKGQNTLHSIWWWPKHHPPCTYIHFYFCAHTQHWMAAYKILLFSK